MKAHQQNKKQPNEGLGKAAIFARFRQLRETQAIRDQHAEVGIAASDFIYPYFVVEGEKQKQSISSLKGIYRFSIDELLADLADTLSLGIDKVLLFGVIDNKLKDEAGTAGYAPDSLICRTVKAIKANYPQVIVFTDVCLCEYTSHGHCGLLHQHDVDNDTTLPLLAKMAVEHARAGADFVAPSSMMDGQVYAIKTALEGAGLPTRILAYSAKYASSFFGPFRDAAGSAPAFGDRKSYQMDYRNRTQGLHEITADLDEGAHWVMVKPAQAYLDIISQARGAYPTATIAAYQVSGEYAMIRAAAEANIINEESAFFESLTAIKRAGANMIISYYAKEFIRKGL